MKEEKEDAATRQQKFQKAGSQSSVSNITRQFAYDDTVLHRAVMDAGRWAFGTVLVEMWVLSEDRTCLFRPEGGWWIDPSFHSQCGDKCQMCRIVNSQRDDYVPPAPLAPGEGLPGVLWRETKRSGSRRGIQHSSEGRGGSIFPDAQPSDRVAWRQVGMIANDPDQPWNPRLQLLASLGLGWAAAVPFSFYGQQGIVVFMAREGVDLVRLQSPENEAYLKSASDFAGAAYALRAPRRNMVKARCDERAAAWRRMRIKIQVLVRMGISIDNIVEENAGHKLEVSATAELKLGESAWKHWLAIIKEKVQITLRKFRGGGSQPPPPFTLRQSLLTFIGCFSTLLLVTGLSFYLTEEDKLDYNIILG
jgi:hypothetical protein